MNNYFRTVAICFSTFLFSACGNSQQKNTPTTDSTTSVSSSERSIDVPIGEHLAGLNLTTDTDWRGVNLGDEFTKVKGIEKGESFESDAEHIGYTIELKNLESADVLYYQTDKKVSAIDVDLFLNTRQSVTDYQKELNAYFTARYGTPKPADSGTVWTGQQGRTVSLKDVSKGKDFGLKIKIGSASGATTASAK